MSEQFAFRVRKSATYPDAVTGEVFDRWNVDKGAQYGDLFLWSLVAKYRDEETAEAVAERLREAHR